MYITNRRTAPGKTHDTKYAITVLELPLANIAVKQIIFLW